MIIEQGEKMKAIPTLKKKGKFYITRKFYIKDEQNKKKKLLRIHKMKLILQA